MIGSTQAIAPEIGAYIDTFGAGDSEETHVLPKIRVAQFLVLALGVMFRLFFSIGIGQLRLI